MVNVQDGKSILKIKVKDAGDFLLDSSVFFNFHGVKCFIFPLGFEDHDIGIEIEHN